jgi:hypothetical protein
MGSERRVDMPFGLINLIRKFIQGTRDAVEKGTNKKQEKIRKKEEKNLDKATKEYQQQDPTLELKPEEVSSELEEALRKALDEHEKQEASFQSVIAQNQGFTPEQINYPDDTEDLVKKYTKENGGELNADIATLRNTGYLMRGQAQNTQMLQMTGNTVTAMAQNMGTMNQAQSAFLENAPQTFQNMVDRNTENLNAVLREFDEKERRRAKFWGAIKSGIMLGPTLMTTTLSAAEKLRVQTESFKQFVGQALGTLMGAKGIFNQLADSIPWLGKIRDKIYQAAQFPALLMEWLPKQFKKIGLEVKGSWIEFRARLAERLWGGENYETYRSNLKAEDRSTHDAWLLIHGNKKYDKAEKALKTALNDRDAVLGDYLKKAQEAGVAFSDLESAFNSSSEVTVNKALSELQRRSNQLTKDKRLGWVTELSDLVTEQRKQNSELAQAITETDEKGNPVIYGFLTKLDSYLKWIKGEKGGDKNAINSINKFIEDHKNNSKALPYLTKIKTLLTNIGDAKINDALYNSQHSVQIYDSSYSGKDGGRAGMIAIRNEALFRAQRDFDKASAEINVTLDERGKELYKTMSDNEGAGEFVVRRAQEAIARDKKIMEDIGIPDSTMESSDVWMHKVCEKYGVPFATALNLQKSEKDPNKRPFGWTEQTIWINDSVWKSVWGKNTNSDSMDLMKVGNPCYTGKGKDKKFVGNLNEWGVGGALKIKENEYTTPKPTTATSTSRTEFTPASTASDIDWDEKYDEYLQATDHSQQYANSQFEESEGAHKRYLIELIQQELSQYGEPIPEDLSPEALNNYTILELDKLLTDIQANGSEYLLRRRKAINNIEFYRTNGLFRGMKNAGGISLDTESVSAFIRRSNLDQIESFSRSLTLAYGSFMDKRDEAREEGKQYEAYIKQQKEAEALDDDLMMEEYYRKLAHDTSSEGEGNEVRDIYNDENMKQARKQHIYEMQHVGKFTKEERQANIDRWNAEHAEEQRKMEESLEKWHAAVNFDGTESVVDNLWDSYKLRLNRYKTLTGNEYLNSAELASMEARIKGKATSAVKIQTIQAYNQTIDNAILNAESVLESQVVGKLHKRQSAQNSGDTEESSNLNEEIRLALEILGKTEAQILDEIRTKSGTTVNVTTANNANTTPQLPGSQYEDQEN